MPLPILVRMYSLVPTRWPHTVAVFPLALFFPAALLARLTGERGLEIRMTLNHDCSRVGKTR